MPKSYKNSLTLLIYKENLKKELLTGRKMTLNLLRPAAGCESLYHLSQRQMHFRAQFEGKNYPIISTKRKPVRESELLRGGSVYWIIKRTIQARQSIISMNMIDDPNGGQRCIIFLDPQIVRTDPFPQKAFQGWRYFKGSDAPKDIGDYSGEEDEEEVPVEMMDDLRELGLL